MSNLEEDYVVSWQAFIPEVEAEILPIYQHHELTFDPGIHGRMHVCRALMFAETLARFYQTHLDVDLNFYGLRVATAFHDAGRQGSGKDEWEKDSARLCYQYLIKGSPYAAAYSKTKPLARSISNWITRRDDQDIHPRILHDADVLEIMRPACGHGGLAGFHPDALRFAGPRDPFRASIENGEKLRQDLISEAWRWIQDTEARKSELAGSIQYLANLLEILRQEKVYFPILSKLVD